MFNSLPQGLGKIVTASYELIPSTAVVVPLHGLLVGNNWAGCWINCYGSLIYNRSGSFSKYRRGVGTRCFNNKFSSILYVNTWYGYTPAFIIIGWTRIYKNNFSKHSLQSIVYYSCTAACSYCQRRRTRGRICYRGACCIINLKTGTLTES